MKRTLAAILALAFTPSLALAQAALLQGGPWTPGHPPQYVGQGSQQPVVSDGGAASGGGPGANLSEIGVTARGTGTPPYAGQGTGAYGTNICDYDAPTTNATGYHFLCFSANAQGGGLLAYGAGGVATPGNLQFIVNGATYVFPFTGSGGGNVVGPGSSTVNDIATFNNTIGSLLKDSGVSLGSQAANLVLATPNGSSGVPSFRALTFPDLPITGSLLSGYVPIATSSSAAAWTNLFGGTTPWTSLQKFNAGLTVLGNPFISQNNYGGGATAPGILGVAGTTSVPTTNPDAPFIFEKIANVPNNTQVNSTVLITSFQDSNGASSWATGLTVISQDNVGGAINSGHFTEASRFQAIVPSGVTGGNPSAIVAEVVTSAGATFETGMVAIEALTFDATGSDQPVPPSFNPAFISIAYLATNNGSSKSDAAFATNYYSASPFQTGVYIAANSVNSAAFYNAAAVQVGISLTGGTYSDYQIDGLGFTIDGSGNAVFASVESVGLFTAAGSIAFDGSSSGAVTMKVQANAGTYNFNLPTTAGTSGYCLESGGGGGTAMSWLACAPLASPTFSGTVTMPDASTWTSSLLTANAVTVAGQLRTTYGTPTIASGACGATTNGSVAGNNQAGVVTIGSATTTTCTVAFSATLANAPNSCVVFPASSGAAATGTTVAYVSSITTGHFVITGSTLASTVYNYICI
jgi:hypothetical protein